MLIRLVWLLLAALTAIGPIAARSSSHSSGSKTVHVRSYTRKDGTVVQAHDRSAPGAAEPSPPSVRSLAPKYEKPAALPALPEAPTARVVAPKPALKTASKCTGCARNPDTGKISRRQPENQAGRVQAT
jgi:hypothetical protein